jgi:ABC-type transport system involved in multi-copper enzyme maturation permease subunit
MSLIGSMTQTVRRVGGLGLDRLAAAGGPVLEKELRVVSRRRFTYILRFGYAALLLIFVSLTWHDALGGRHSPSPQYAVSRMAQAGQSIIMVLAWFQFVALQWVAMLMLCGAVSEEIHRRTLGVLLASPVTAMEVVAGKLSSRLLQIGLLLALGLPVMLVVRVLGGVSAGFIAISTCITLSTVVFLGSFSLLLSVSDKRPWLVFMKTLVIGGLFFGLVPAMIATIAHRPSGEPLMLACAYVNPWLALGIVTYEELEPMRKAFGSPFYWPFHCLAMLGAGALLLTAAAARIRRRAPGVAAAGEEARARPGRWRARQAAPVRPVGDSPVAWRELHTGTFRSRLRAILLGIAALGLLLATYAALGSHGLDQPDVHVGYGLVFYALGVLVTALLAATCITTEKEAETWPALLATPLTGGEILMGKAVGVLRRSLPVWMLLFLHLWLFTGLGHFRYYVALHTMMVAAGMAVLAMGVGLYLSAACRKTTTAVVLTLAVLAALWVGMPMGLVGTGEVGAGIRGTSELLLCFTPLIQAVSVLLFRPAMGMEDGGRYNWPHSGLNENVGEAGQVILVTSLVQIVLGVLLAAAAARRVRPQTAWRRGS